MAAISRLLKIMATISRLLKIMAAISRLLKIRHLAQTLLSNTHPAPLCTARSCSKEYLYGVATISRSLKIKGLFWKGAL